jgi:hypothetical protein
MTMELALPLASTLTAGDSSVTTTLCCSTTMAMEMSTCFTCPAVSCMAGDVNGAKPSTLVSTI